MGGVVESSLGGVQHEARARSGLRREPLFEDVRRVLRLDTRNGEVVTERSADAALQRKDDERGHKPHTEHPERVAGGAATEAVQKCTHVILLVAPARLRD